MNYELILGRSGEAVGLSAISFSATLQKDAAPIPNALAAIKNLKLKFENWILSLRCFASLRELRRHNNS